jgi:hypothetical protein
VRSSLRVNESNRVRREFPERRNIPVGGMEVERIFGWGKDQRIFFEKLGGAVRRFGQFPIEGEGVVSPFL